MTDLAAQIACVKRELALRERVYPKWVAAGRMKLDAADRELAAMRAVLATLHDLQRATPCDHEWKQAIWEQVVGVSRCLKCGAQRYPG